MADEIRGVKQPSGRDWRKRVSRRQVWAIVACIAYVASPLDLMPEAILGPLGLPDDVAALVAAALLFISGRRARRSAG